MKTSKPSDSPTAWCRITHYLAATGLQRDAFLSACKRGDLPFEITQLGAARIWYARPRRSEPTLAQRVYSDRRSAGRAPIDETERHPTRAAEIYARAR